MVSARPRPGSGWAQDPSSGSWRRSARDAVPWPAGPVVGALAGCGAATTGILVSSQAPPYPWPMWSVVQAVGLSFVAAGVIAWIRQPTNGSGRLMTVVGTTWYIGDLQTSSHPVLFAVGFVLFYLTSAIFTHLILALPTGRLPGRGERWVVGGQYASVTVTQLLRYLSEDSPPPQVWGGLENLSIWAPVGGISGGVMTIAGLVLVIRRWRAAGKPSRRTLAALWSTVAVGALIVLVWIGLVWGPLAWQDAVMGQHPVDVQGAMLFTYALTLNFVPFAILAGLLRVRLARIGVAALVMRLEHSAEPRRLRDALADALGDPTLQVCFRLPSGGYVDVDGHPTEVPSTPDRAVTLVERQGEQLAALVHDPALINQAPLIDAAVAAASLAMENARLHAEQRAQLEAVRASRARMVAAADEERHRIQRDLHDGAQHKLLAISLLVGQVREALRQRRDATSTAEMLNKAATQLHDVIRELRELIEGIDPPALTEQGLAVVVETLAERAPLPVIFDIPPRRWPRPLERTAYFVINESLANIYKHAKATRATVRIEADDRHLVIEVTDDGVGGADAKQGTGLRGLRDRVATVNGELVIDSRPETGTQIKVELPCV